jgi:hypothetical protein
MADAIAKTVSYALTLLVLCSLVWAALIVPIVGLAVMLWLSAGITAIGFVLTPYAEHIKEQKR